MRKTLREEILSVNIKKDNTYDEILDIIDDYCHKNHKNTSIRFAIGFYYLFIAAVERGSLLCDDGLGLASDIFILLYPEITVRTSSKYPYINTFLHVTNMYIDPMGWWARRLKSEKYIAHHVIKPLEKYFYNTKRWCNFWQPHTVGHLPMVVLQKCYLMMSFIRYMNQ